MEAKEIKVKDLRIGNLIEYNYPDGGWGTHPVSIEDFEDIEKECFRSIPLTEEWLVKLGFKKWQDRLCIEAWAKGHPSQRFDIDFKDGNIIMNSRYQEHSDCLVMGHIQHVHSLQNLYFALTGEELAVK